MHWLCSLASFSKEHKLKCILLAKQQNKYYASSLVRRLNIHWLTRKLPKSDNNGNILKYLSSNFCHFIYLKCYHICQLIDDNNQYPFNFIDFGRHWSHPLHFPFIHISIFFMWVYLSTYPPNHSINIRWCHKTHAHNQLDYQIAIKTLFSFPFGSWVWYY